MSRDERQGYDDGIYTVSVDGVRVFGKIFLVEIECYM